jgi:hypothetical protein
VSLVYGSMIWVDMRHQASSKHVSRSLFAYERTDARLKFCPNRRGERSMDQIRIYPKKVFCVIASFAMNSEDVYIADGSYCDTGSYYYYVEIKPFSFKSIIILQYVKMCK